MAVKISKPSKMPCGSWGLQAVDTCPGAVNPVSGAMVDCCKYCYTRSGNYRFKNVRDSRAHNKEDWRIVDN